MAVLATSNAEPNADKPPRPRRRIPLSLRMFLAIVGVLGLGVPAYRQHLAIREIERAGGYIQSLPRSPKILREWFGEAHMRPFDEVYLVWLDEGNASDDTLARISCLGELRSLSLINTQIGDAGLAHLGAFRQLEDLSLSGTRITDAGLVHLGRLTSLQSLGLNQTHITDDGLTQLKGLPNLESLSVTNTFVTYAGVVDLCQACPRLMRISR